MENKTTIILKKYNSINDSIYCTINNCYNNIDSMNLNFYELYNNGYNCNNFITNNGKISSDCNFTKTKLNYLNNNIEFFETLYKLTTIYKNCILDIVYKSDSKYYSKKELSIFLINTPKNTHIKDNSRN